MKKNKKTHWQENLKIIGILFFIWACFSFIPVLFADNLNKFSFFNVPLGFWLSQQGSIIAFVIITFVYAKLMNKLDKKYDTDKDEDRSLSKKSKVSVKNQSK